MIFVHDEPPVEEIIVAGKVLSKAHAGVTKLMGYEFQSVTKLAGRGLWDGISRAVKKWADPVQIWAGWSLEAHADTN